MLFFGYLLLILSLLTETVWMDVKDLLEEANDDSVVTIPEGFYHSDTIKINEKANVEYKNSGTVVIECADESIMNPLSSTWTTQGDFYKTTYTKNSCSTRQIYAAIGSSVTSDPYNIDLYSERRQLWTYESYEGLEVHSFEDGVFFDTSTSTLYIYFEDGSNPNSLPNDQQLFISCGRCVQVKRSNDVSFSNIIFDNGGEYVFYIQTCDGIKFNEVHIFGGINGIRFFTDTKNSGIENSIVGGFPRNDIWTWQGYKANDNMLGDGIGFKTSGTSNYCRNNDVSGYFNGITAQNPTTGITTDQCNNNLVISGNTIHEIQDDGFEIEPCNINVRIFNNILFNVYTGVSFAPVTHGPVYLYQNLIIADKIVPYSSTSISSPKCMKMVSGYEDRPENAKIYHNTFFSKYGKVIYGNTKEELGTKDFEYYNNIFYQKYKTYPETQKIIKYSGLSSDGNEYDYNIHFSEDYVAGETAMYSYFNDYSSGNSFDTLSEALSSPAGVSSGWATHSLEGDPKVKFSVVGHPQYYVIDTESIGYESAGDVIPGTWPLDDILSSKPASERHIGLNTGSGIPLRDYFICYGKKQGDIDSDDNNIVCNGHGVCIDEDTCDCDENYGGDECESFSGVTCFGISQSDTDDNVCSGNGDCIAEDTCQCTSDLFYGDACDLPNPTGIRCYGIAKADTSNVCSGNGDCNSETTNCDCFEGFEGDECGTDVQDADDDDSPPPAIDSNNSDKKEAEKYNLMIIAVAGSAAVVVLLFPFLVVLCLGCFIFLGCCCVIIFVIMIIGSCSCCGGGVYAVTSNISNNDKYSEEMKYTKFDDDDEEEEDIILSKKSVVKASNNSSIIQPPPRRDPLHPPVPLRRRIVDYHDHQDHHHNNSFTDERLNKPKRPPRPPPGNCKQRRYMYKDNNNNYGVSKPSRPPARINVPRYYKNFNNNDENGTHQPAPIIMRPHAQRRNPPPPPIPRRKPATKMRRNIDGDVVIPPKRPPRRNKE